MGMKRGEKQGNLIIYFTIDFPAHLSAEQKAQFKCNTIILILILSILLFRNTLFGNFLLNNID